ncbi:MAG TPA: methyltransferase domain-containing protein [Thermoleophilaceae bacterium]|nr:methyltransferase domain-containing protein [Thermoleophilaceae bacterium]
MGDALLDLLACPHEGGALRSDGRSLTCAEGHTFPVEGGIPRLAADQDDQEGTYDTFSAKWDQVSEEELHQRFEQQYQWYVERYGYADEADLARALEGKEAILDAGTGVGGDAARFARLGTAQVVGMDLSNGIAMAQKTFGGTANLHYVQGDILHPPFGPDTFDWISSDQVIHHTPDAPRAFATLARLLRPGGQITVYVYKVKAPMREYADDYLRERTTKMSVEDCMAMSAGMSELGRELSALDATVTLEHGVPLLGIEPGEHDVQRLFYWHFVKAFWNDSFSPHLNDLVNFDWYHPPYASRHTPEEVTGWCAEAGLEVEHLDVGDSGISVRARRPG